MHPIGNALPERLFRLLLIDTRPIGRWHRLRGQFVLLPNLSIVPFVTSCLEMLQQPLESTQYCSREHRKLLHQHGLVASMSARGNCYDNAAMESWNHSLKIEAIHGERFATREIAITHVFEYIEVDHNRTPLHSTLGYSVRSSLS